MKKLMLTLFVFSSALASAHQITNETMIRCKAGVSPERCERQRQNALAKKCITQEDFNELRNRGGMPTCYEEDGSFMGWCPCGCFAPDTKIQLNAANGQEETAQRLIELFAQGHRPEVANLSAESSLKGGLKYKTTPIRNVSVGPEEIPMVIIDTESQGSTGHIELTINHPVLLADGTILRAERLQPGQKLINYLGKSETIKSITRRKFDGLVYNLNVNTPVDSEHIVVANGLLMGDLFLQGDLGYFENQVLVRQ